MQTHAQKWGNSLGLRIPKALAQAANIEPGALITLSVVKGKLIIERVTDYEYSLDELLADVTTRNMHTETDTGGAVGREVW